MKLWLINTFKFVGLKFDISLFKFDRYICGYLHFSTFLVAVKVENRDYFRVTICFL